MSRSARSSEIRPDARLLDRLASSVLTLTIASVIPVHAQHEPGISQPMTSGFPDVQLHI